MAGSVLTELCFAFDACNDEATCETLSSCCSTCSVRRTTARLCSTRAAAATCAFFCLVSVTLHKLAELEELEAEAVQHSQRDADFRCLDATFLSARHWQARKAIQGGRARCAHGPIVPACVLAVCASCVSRRRSPNEQALSCADELEHFAGHKPRQGCWRVCVNKHGVHQKRRLGSGEARMSF